MFSGLHQECSSPWITFTGSGPEDLGLSHPGNQVAQAAAASFEISRQLFKRLLTSKFKLTAKSVCPYFLT